MILSGNESRTLPIINYDEMKGTIHMQGRSISPEVEDYFEEFIPYFKDCLLKNPTNLDVKLELQYFNNKTAKILMDFFKVIKDIVDKGYDANIEWLIEKGDEDLIEVIKDYIFLTDLKMKIIEE
jgi:hypothetical protein